jgi:hypothetical protein
MAIVTIILYIVAVYLAMGFLFMIPFVIKGVDRIDEGAHGSSIGFRIIIIPGVIVFWIVLLSKWMKIRPLQTSPKKEA